MTTMRKQLLQIWGTVLCLAALVFFAALILAALTNPGEERAGWELWLLGCLAVMALGFVSMLISLHTTSLLSEQEKRTWHRRMWVGIPLSGVYFLLMAARHGGKRPARPSSQ
jgi:hypothetical protein